MTKDLENRNLGALLKKILAERSLSMRKLSELTEIDTATISRIINGKRKATLTHLQKISDCLDIPLSELLVSTGYSLEKKQAGLEGNIQSSVEGIQNFLSSTNLYDKEFTLESIEQQLADYEQYAQTEEGKDIILNSFDEKIKKVSGIGPFISHLEQMYEKFRLHKGTRIELALIGGVLMYFILPVDVIPDYIFPIGYLDDAIAVQLGLNFFKK